MTAAAADPWARLLELAERERDLAAAGRWVDLAAAGGERARLAATLGPPSAGTRPLLERLDAVQAELIATLARARAETVDALGALRRRRGAMHGYAARPGRPAGGWVDQTG